MCLLCLSICIIPSCLLTKMFEFLLLSLGLHVQPISWLGITLITCCHLQRPWVWFGRSNCPLGFEFHVRRICVSGVFAVVALSCWGIDVELGFFLYSEFQKFVQDFLSPWMLHGLCWQLVYQRFGATCRSNCVTWSKLDWTAWSLKMGMIGCVEMSISIYQPTLCNISEALMPQLHQGGSLNEISQISANSI